MAKITDEMFQKLIEEHRELTTQLEKAYHTGVAKRKNEANLAFGDAISPRFEEKMAKLEAKIQEEHILFLAEKTLEFNKVLKKYGYTGVFLR